MRIGHLQCKIWIPCCFFVSVYLGGICLVLPKEEENMKWLTCTHHRREQTTACQETLKMEVSHWRCHRQFGFKRMNLIPFIDTYFPPVQQEQQKKHLQWGPCKLILEVHFYKLFHQIKNRITTQERSVGLLSYLKTESWNLCVNSSSHLSGMLTIEK